MDFFDEISTAATRFAKGAYRKTEDFANKAKLDLEAYSISDKMRQNYELIGEIVYKKHFDVISSIEDDQLSHALCEAEELKERQKRVSAKKNAEFYCPSCGRTLKKDMCFCPTCGKPVC